MVVTMRTDVAGPVTMITKNWITKNWITKNLDHRKFSGRPRSCGNRLGHDAVKPIKGGLVMKPLAIGCVVLATLFSTAAFSRGSGGGGMGMHHSSSVTGGAFGTKPTAPGTNSAGTALSSSGGSAAVRGPALGTGDPAVDQEDRKAARMMSSICRGC
jgi:hypothetical protein